MPYNPPQGGSFPGTAATGDVLAGSTFSSTAGTNIAGTMPNNPAPSGIVQPGGSLVVPAGYSPGGTIDGAPIKVAYGQVTSSSATSSFTVLGGGSQTLYTATIPVPVGLVTVVAVHVFPSALGTYSSPSVSSPLGYMDGANATVLSYAQYSNSDWYQVIAGAPLSLTASSIVVPFGSGSQTVQYVLLYT